MTYGTVGVYFVAYFQYGYAANSFNFMASYFQYYRTYIEAVMLLFLIGFTVKINYLYAEMEKRTNCRIKTVTLDELSKIWITAERQEEILRMKLMEEVNEEMEVRNAVLATIIFEINSSYDFFDKYIKPNLRFINLKELVVIRDLLVILEKEGSVSSVAKAYGEDPEVIRFQSEQAGDRTSYEIYATFSLYDHTLRVARKILEEIKKGERDVNIGWEFKIGKALVIALAHDIGKIEIIKHLKISQPHIIREKISHAAVSQKMFLSAFFDYEDASEMGELILNHHSARKDLDHIGVHLVNADKEARKEEMTVWNEHSRHKTIYVDLYHKTVDVGDSSKRNESAVKPAYSMPKEVVFDVVEELRKKVHIEIEDDETNVENGDAEQEKTESIPDEKTVSKQVRKEIEAREQDFSSINSCEFSVEEAEMRLFSQFGLDDAVETAASEIHTKAPPIKDDKALKKPKEKKILKEYGEKADTVPVAFDFGSIESRFKEEIFSRLNTRNSKTFKIECITYKTKMLLSTEALRGIIIKLLIPESFDPIDSYMAYVVERLAEQKMATEASISSKKYYSTYSLYDESKTKHKFICISISGEYLDMGYEQLEMNRKNSQISKITVVPFGKNHETG